MQISGSSVSGEQIRFAILEECSKGACIEELGIATGEAIVGWKILSGDTAVANAIDKYIESTILSEIPLNGLTFLKHQYALGSEDEKWKLYESYRYEMEQHPDSRTVILDEFPGIVYITGIMSPRATDLV